MHNIYPNLWQETTPDGDPNPFLDIRVRQAANHAINRRAIIDNLFLGVGDMSMLVYSGVPGYPSPEQKAEVVFDYNVEKAKQLMAEAGYEDGFDVPLYYTPDWGGDVVADLVLVASQDLAQNGIRVTPVPTLGSEYFTPQYSSGRDAAPWGLYWFYANAVPDIGSMWECCGGADGFFTISPPQDPRLQELYLAQRVEQDPDRRLEIISEVLLEHTRQATFIFIVRAAGHGGYPGRRQLSQGRPGRKSQLPDDLRDPAAQDLRRVIRFVTPALAPASPVRARGRQVRGRPRVARRVERGCRFSTRRDCPCIPLFEPGAGKCGAGCCAARQ